MDNKNLIFGIINNEEKLYSGNLCYYFKLVFNSPNAANPYHNFRHMMYVTCTTYECAKSVRYREINGESSFRALMIAAMFHDYDHGPVMSNSDQEDIDKAVLAIEKYILEEDIKLLPEITMLIRETEFPHKRHGFSLGGSILRDADLSQALEAVWIQQIIFGFSVEMNVPQMKVLQLEINYLSGLKFETSWAREKFGILAQLKINEINELIKILS